MCGIVGFVRTTTHTSERTKKCVEELLLNNIERGRDAAGALITYGNTVSTVKGAGTAQRLIATKGWKVLMKYPYWDMFIGHTRAATHGPAYDNKNNHPHSTAKYEYSLVHNGIINAPVPDGIQLQSQCDSEIALRLFETYGIVNGAKELAKLTDGYAIFCIDTVKKQFYALRGHYPIFYINLPNILGGTLFSSTKESIQFALASTGFAWRSLTDQIKSLQANTLYSMQPNSPKWTTVMALSPHISSAYRDVGNSCWDDFFHNKAHLQLEAKHQYVQKELNRYTKNADGVYEKTKVQKQIPEEDDYGSYI